MEDNPSTSYDELKWKSAPPLDHSIEHDEDSTSIHSDTSKKTCSLPLWTEKTALLVVDVQPEYWSQCPAVRQDFPDFPSRLQATVETCRQQNCAKIIWVRADYRYAHSPWLKQFARIHGLEDKKRSKNMRTEVPCDEFTWDDFATPIEGEVILTKTSWSSTSNTLLMDILREAQVDTVLVCGLITSVCVQHSAFGIFEAGYRTILVTDACADRGKARHEAALALYGDYMYELITSSELETFTSSRGLEKARPSWILPPLSKPQNDNSTVCEESSISGCCSPHPQPLSTASTLSRSTSASSLSLTDASFAIGAIE